MTPMASMIRCISRVIDGLPLDSRGLPPLIWLAVAVLKMGFVALFAEAADLLQHVINTLYRHEIHARSDLVSLFESSLSVLEGGKMRVDRYLSLDSDYRLSLSLGAALMKGLRHPPTCSSAEALLRSLLQFGVRFIQPLPQSSRPIHPSIIGFFLALLSTCKSKLQLKELIRMAGSDVGFTNGVSENDTDPETIQVSFKMLGITNADYALLVTTFLISMLNSSQSNKERDMLFALLSELSLAFPDVITITYICCVPASLASALMCLPSRFESMLDKINDTYVTSNNPRILQSLSTICTQTNKLSPASAASSFSFLFESHASRYLSRSRLHEERHRHTRASAEHLRVLEATNMLDLLDDHQFVPLDHPSSASQVQGMQNLVTSMLACF